MCFDLNGVFSSYFLSSHRVGHVNNVNYVIKYPCTIRTCITKLEHVGVDILNFTVHCTLKVYLISPMNTTSLLLDMTTFKDCDKTINNNKLRLSSSNFWGESTNGTWILWMNGAELYIINPGTFDTMTCT